MKTLRVPITDVGLLATQLANRIVGQYGLQEYHLVAIPRGGVPVAYVLAERLRAQGSTASMSLPSDHVRTRSTSIVVDDIVVTGETMKRVLDAGEAVLGVALYAKPDSPPGVWAACKVPVDTWVQFPWEERDDDLGKPEDAVRRLIEYLGEDPTEEDLLDTPKRVLRFYDELREARDAEIVATTFSSTVQDFVVTSGIPFASLCRHHMLPYFGEAAIGYVPHGKILGLSKPPRAVQQAAGALTVQEHLTAQVAEQVREWTASEDVAVVTTAVHSCMVIRGVKALGARTSASTMLGKFRTAPSLRAEFFAVIGEARSLA